MFCEYNCFSVKKQIFIDIKRKFHNYVSPFNNFLYVFNAFYFYSDFYRRKKKINFQGSGELKPGRKGISLSGEQYQRLKAIMSDIDEKLSSA